MNGKRMWLVVMAALIGALLAGGVAGGVTGFVSTDRAVVQGTTHFGDIKVQDFTAVGDVSITGGIAQTGDMTVTGYVLVDGSGNETQLTVQGFTTQTANLLVCENSGGTDKFTVDNSGNVVAAGHADVQDYVYDSTGEFNILGYAQVTGNTDNDQWTITGYTTQTNDLLVCENSDGTDLVVVDGSGNLDITGYLRDIAGTTVGIYGGADVLPNSDTTQLTVLGYTTQTANLVSFQQTGGTPVFDVASDGDTYVAGELDVHGTVTTTADVYLGDGSADNIYVYGQMRTWDGTNWIEVPDVGALSRGDGWHTAWTVEGWGSGVAFQALFANTQVMTTTPSQNAYGVEAKATYNGAVGSGTATAYGLYGKITAKSTGGVNSVIPKAYPVYSMLGVDASNLITEAASFYAENSNSGTEVASYILRTHDTPGRNAWDYGIYLDDAVIGTADIVLENGAQIANAVTGTTTVSGAVDVAGALNFGANDLYPLGSVADGYLVFCSVTSGFTASITVAVGTHGVTTPTAAIATMITTPITTAVFIGTSISGDDVVINSRGADYNAGSTEVTAYYCVYGQK